jgi:hypothetical protein
MEEILESAKGETDGSWDPIADEQGVQSLILTNYLATDESYVLVFNNGHMELVFHPDSGDYAHDGDMWDVTSLGWA